MSSINSGPAFIAELFSSVVDAAAAHEYVPARALISTAKAHGYRGTAKALVAALDDAGHPCYQGVDGRQVIMGVKFK
jgi:hypothetical protein